ncbi:radical SAM protein [Patescibacteria group bacterium]|nr:radical SAM protein [Patescibacteria group bacterium]
MELRFIVTQKCPLNCVYCHAEGMRELKQESLDVDDYAFMYRCGQKALGSNSSTISGGEPLVRPDILPIARKLKELGSGLVLVSNAVLLDKKLEIGDYLQEIHISVDTLSRDKYSFVCGQDYLPKVKNNICQLRKKYPDLTIKLIVVLMRNINGDWPEMKKLINFAQEQNLIIKVLEELNDDPNRKVMPLLSLEKKVLANQGKLIKTDDRKKVFDIEGVQIELAYTNCSLMKKTDSKINYCQQNNDIFISPNGLIKPCFMREKTINVLPEVKKKDEAGFINKINQAKQLIGNDCPLQTVL